MRNSITAGSLRGSRTWTPASRLRAGAMHLLACFSRAHDALFGLLENGALMIALRIDEHISHRDSRRSRCFPLERCSASSDDERKSPRLLKKARTEVVHRMQDPPRIARKSALLYRFRGE